MSKYSCIQITIGDKIYQFRDVDTGKSTSLNSIIRSITSNSDNKEQIEAILSRDTDIQTLLDTNYTNVGDLAIGNAKPSNIASLVKVSHKPLIGEEIEKLLSNVTFTDNNILITENGEPATIYCGTKRDFLAINRETLSNPSRLVRALSYLYASKKVNDPNSKVSRIIDEGLSKIRDSVPELYEINAEDPASLRKLVLAKLSSLSENQLVIDNLIKPIASAINQGVSESKNKLNDTIGIETPTVIKLAEYANYKTTINGNIYSNAFILRTLDKIDTAKLRDVKVDESKFEEADYVPNRLKLYYSSLNESDQEYRLLTDIIFNKDPEFIDNIFGEGSYSKNLIKYLNKPLEELEETLEDDRFWPIVGKVNIDDNFAVSTSKINISDKNYDFNKEMVKNPDTAFQIILDNKQSQFVRIDNSSKVLKVYINLNLEYTNKDADIIRKAVSKTTNKKEVPYKTKLHILKQKEDYPKGNLSKLSSIISDLRKNNSFITEVKVAGTQDFALDVAKAAHENNIRTFVFPEYYGSVKNKGDIYKYLDSTLNLNYLSNYIEAKDSKQFNDIQNFNIGLFTTKDLKENDPVTIKSGNSEIKRAVDRVVTLAPVRNYDTFNNEINGYTSGSIVMINSGGSTVEGVILYKLDEDNYYVMNTKEKIPQTINRKDFVGEPIYMIEPRTVDGIIYYRTNSMVLAIDQEGNLYPYERLEGFLKYHEDELRDIYEHTNKSISYEDFVASNFHNKADLNKKFVIFKPLTRENLQPAKTLPDNYSNSNIIELIVGGLRRSGLKVNFFNTKNIKRLYGDAVSQHKAFIHNGEIILNSDKYTEDSPIHELMHLLLGQLKVTNPNKYRELLQSVPETQEYQDLREMYSELTAEDYIEEVLVHSLTNFFMGRIYDKNVDISSKWKDLNIKDLASRLFKTNGSFRQTDDSDFMRATLESLLLDSNSSLLNDLAMGTKRSEIIINNQVSNWKSKLYKDGDLEQDCK